MQPEKIEPTFFPNKFRDLIKRNTKENFYSLSKFMGALLGL
jgi:hypothetical protein